MKKLIGMTTAIIMGAALFTGCNQTSTSVAIDPPQEVTQDSVQGNTQGSAARKYVDYSPTAVAEATKDGGKAILFFHAKWCPTCKAAEKEILENKAQLPENVTIIKADFDSETELKKQYQIVNQHTFVQVDDQGVEITRWVGGGLKNIVQRVQ